MNEDIQKYFKEIRNIYLQGDYTEGTLRTPFENFIRSISPSIRLIQEPKRVKKLGAPDFKSFYRSRKVGFIETKDLDKNLDNELESDQLNKYINSINNLILTNYSRFILIRNGQNIFDFNLFALSDLDNAKHIISDDIINVFTQFINEFFSYKLPTISSAEELSKELAKKAKLLKDFAQEQLKDDLKKVKNNEFPSSIYDFYEGIKELIKDISIEDCSDAYAQTVTYGLFLARRNCPKLERRTATFYIPKGVGVIKRIFVNISGDAFPSNISWIIDDIVDVLNASNVKDILTSIDKRGKKDKDPLIYFYEDFLNLYEPEKRKHLGVYYTPRPVVNFIVNSINLILKKDFEKTKGFAEDTVHVLDPAIGTGTFFWIAFLLTLKELKDAGLRGLIKEKIENHILKHFYGFEILITPYVISHLKITDLLKRWHYQFKDSDRIQIYLTNTLEPTEVHGLIPFLREITEESRLANQIKMKKPILVVMGNPPYAGMSVNKGKWIDDLLKKGYSRLDGSKDDGYYKVDGEPLGEKNPKWLQDDYVKFIRFAQWKIDKSGEGVIGFITNHSYLDNPTFRGMRKSLIDSFNQIYILNLHGNVLKKEKCKDGSKDENVFGIRQGVTIALYIKNNKLKEKKIFYADLYGLKEEKYSWLDRHNINNVSWKEIKPISPHYFFIPKDNSLLEEYNKYWKLTDIFPISSVGIVTSRDNFVINSDKEILKRNIESLRDNDNSDEYIRNKFKLKDKTNWKLSDVRKTLMKNENWKNSFTKVLYRPFDSCWIFYDNSLIERPRRDVMQHMMHENLGLCIGRQWSAVGSSSYDVVFISDKIVDFNLFRRGGELIFPFYLYSNNERKININPNLFKFLNEKYGEDVSPENILYYIYAILYSPKYRKKYDEFLQYDFPRIPFINDFNKFKKLSELGKELADLHLMKKRLSSQIKFDVSDSNIVQMVKFQDCKLFINEKQYFDGVPEDSWNFYIGGYPVLEKWLKGKNKKNKMLSSKDIEDFIQIIEIIRHTIEIMKKLDKMDIV